MVERNALAIRDSAYGILTPDDRYRIANNKWYFGTFIISGRKLIRITIIAFVKKSGFLLSDGSVWYICRIFSIQYALYLINRCPGI